MAHLDMNEIESTEPEPRGEAWDDLIKALTLLRKGATGPYPTHCEHDELWAMADSGRFTPEEIAQLDRWGFFVSEDGFKSFRFGSA